MPVNFNFDLTGRRKQKEIQDQLSKLNTMAFGQPQGNAPPFIARPAIPGALPQTPQNQIISQLLSNPSTSSAGIQETLRLLEEQRLTQQAQAEGKTQRDLAAQLAANHPELGDLAQLVGSFGGKASDAFVGSVTPQKTSGDILQFMQAKSQGLIDPDMSYQSFVEMKKQSPVNVNFGDGSFKVSEGFMLKDPADPSKGVTPIPGGPKDALAGENAGKTQMLRSAAEQLPLIKSLIFNADGTPNYTNIGYASANVPKTEGRKLRAAMEVGIQAITRLETGAAMAPSEVENTRKRFQPSVLDTDEIVKLKFEMFNDFITGAIKLIDPSGRFDSKRFESELKSRMAGNNKVIDFAELP